MFEQPINKASQNAFNEKGLSRRDLLKKSLASLAGLTLAGQAESVLGKDKVNKNPEVKEYPEARVMIEAEAFMMDLLASNQGVFYGETHDGNPANEEFMIENLEKFRQAGVRVIAIEMVDSEDQHLIEAYYNDPDKNKEALFQYTESNLGRFLLIEAARKAGMRVIGIDMKARHAGQPNWKKIQSEEVNQWWAHQVKREMMNRVPNEKYIVYGGFYHSRSDGTGVNSFLDIPSIIPVNRNDYQKPFFALRAGTKIIPGRPKLADYQRVYAKSFNDFCKENVEYYKNKAPEITKAYQELDVLISRFLEGSSAELIMRVHEVVNGLLSKVEEWDHEYLIQLQKAIR